MKVKTRCLGDIELPESDVLRFPEGILGFPNSRRFALITIENNPHLKVLQDIDNEQLSFLVIRPWDFFEDYEADIADGDLEQIGITEANMESFSLHSIVTIGKTMADSTANLVAPIVINHHNNTGRQFVLESQVYRTKHRLQREGAGE